MRGAECRGEELGYGQPPSLPSSSQPPVGAGRSGFEANPKIKLNGFITNNSVILTLVRVRSPTHRGTNGTNEG